MKNHSRTFRQLTLLITGVSSVALLAACDTMNHMRDEFTGESRHAQRVDGGRRAPMLNPGIMPHSAASMPAPQMAAATPAPAAPSPTNNPYDYYDNEGNPVEPKEMAKAPAEGESSKSGFFNRMFGSRGNSAAQDDKAMRKPLPGNPASGGAPAAVAAPVASTSVRPLLAPQDSAPIQEEYRSESAPASDSAPQAEARSSKPSWLSRLLGPSKSEPVEPAESQDAPDAQEPHSELTPPSEPKVIVVSEPKTVTEAPVTADAPDAQPSSSRSWLDRMLGRPEKKLDEADRAAEAAPYPSLASVPPAPQALSERKQEKSAHMDDLAMEHALAQEEKQLLDSEPSQQQPLTPVDMPQDKAQTSAILNSPAEEQASASSDVPVLLGHATALPDRMLAAEPKPVPVVSTEPAEEPGRQRVAMPEEKPLPPALTQSAPAMVQETPSEPVQNAASAEAPAAVVTAASEQPARKPYFWEGWHMPFSKKKDTEKKEEEQESAPEDTASESFSPPLPEHIDAISALPQPQPAQPTPLLASPEPNSAAPASTMVPVTQPVASVAEQPQEQAQEAAPAAGPGGLPSPQMLQSVRMLPPSRYTVRQAHPSSSQ